jgi:hypothetical protein
MKSIYYYALAFIACFGLASCSSDHEEPEPTLASVIFTPNEPSAGRVASISRAGVFGKDYNWTFTYDSNNLKAASRTEQKGDAWQTAGEQTDYSLTYTPSNVIVSTSGKAITINVKSNGLLESLTCGNETCEYIYSDNKLIRWESKFILDGKTDSQERYATGDIVWENDNIKTIKYIPFTEADHKFFTYEITYSENENNDNGIFPELIAEAMGVNGVEFLYYAGMMGKATTHLVKSIKVSHSTDESKNETYNFLYNRANGNVTYCNFTSVTESNNVPVKNVVVTYRY